MKTNSEHEATEGKPMDDGKKTAESAPESVNEAALPDAEVEQMDPVAHLEASLSEAQDKYLRLYSEFENYKKRVARDRVDQSRMAAADTWSAILPVIDDFERAIKAMESKAAADPALDGIRLIYSKLKSITEARGLKPMDAIGKPFDPELHDAITRMPAPDDSMKGAVLDEVEKGYFLHDRVLRHAKVVVGQ
ncbi:MAG: nucleotide exchange factor GrpE [Bacteroidota bacterium]|jgi:molecular chaperone GrpE|uniref:nucleotide exchange factor GrpE n=1 Tax=Candidatus Pollutiaquabacter sp. TaxID=3416354 RepID=UPI00394C2ADD|nr:nucleotide exchange factor GrpE [Bacteroidota bacterium]